MNGREGFREEPDIYHAASPPELGLSKRRPLRWIIPLVILVIASFIGAFFLLLQSPQVKARKHLEEAYDHF